MPAHCVRDQAAGLLEFSQGGAEPARQLMYRMSGWMVAVGLPVTVLFVCAPSALASMILGGELAAAVAEVLPWTAIGAFMSVFLTLYFAMAFQIARRTEWMLLAVAPAAVLNIMSNLVLLPRFGVVAAGWSTVTSMRSRCCGDPVRSRHFRAVCIFGRVACGGRLHTLVAFLQFEFHRRCRVHS